MKKLIPEYSLAEVINPLLSGHEKAMEYFSASFSAPMKLSTFPHRATYFGVAVCTNGSAELTANLEQYTLCTNALIVMGPEVIRSWKAQSFDYAEEILFFTAAFFLETQTGGNMNSLEDFSFFDAKYPTVLHLNSKEAALIRHLLRDIKNTNHSKSSRQEKIVRNYISIALNQVADLYDQYYPENQHLLKAPDKTVQQFKKLLLENYLQFRGVNAYAGLMNISSKHLSQSIKESTGKTAGQWIHELLILEAKVRLRQSSENINQIAEALNFSDASVFGKYFRRYAGCSPALYRKQGSAHLKIKQ
ncbi:helix-turn-helix domain-containing protein [Pedobacter nutrimenti]|uniref:AraC-like DNA-binding protein n=1 Tax=Pedobacter nutrimenti TaxID=1241337 RepID=A0A318UNL7_9SPHI|nr:AraC family transcriptional regulator [Pedobacter nutrimenti]PYF77047.1 AraC-like DNA-binding protein [Pedobacter nutrimenti]